MKQNFDIIIVGGGIVGLSLAKALSTLAYRIALIDASDELAEVPSQLDQRSLALAHSSYQILNTLGLWQAIEPQACPIKTIHVSEQGKFGRALLDCDDVATDALGFVIPIVAFAKHLQQQVANCATVTVLRPATVTLAKQTDDHWQLDVTHAEQTLNLTASLLIAADGSRSFLRQQLNIATSVKDYQQTAIATSVTVNQPIANRAYERFTPTGPIAFLPRGDNCYGVVWVVKPDDVESILALSDAAFCQALQQAFGSRLGTITSVGKKQAYPLKQLLADPPSLKGFLLLGNALHTIHPAAGLGFNLGLRDVAHVAEILHDMQQAKISVNDPSLNKRLSACTAQDQKRVNQFTDLLVRLFDHQFPIVSHARALGLSVFDCLPLLKRRFTQKAMGQFANLPKLARGIPLESQHENL